MDEIKEWQTMWQNQESKPMNVDQLIERLNNIETNLNVRRYCLIGAAVVLTFIALFYISKFDNIYFTFGYTLLGISVAIKLVVLYKGKYSLIQHKIDLNNPNFIQNQIVKLKEKILIKKQHLIAFLLLTIIGLNLVLIGMHQTNGAVFDFEMFKEKDRIMIHSSTIILLIMAYIINSKKIDEYKKNVLELIKEIEDNNSIHRP